MNDSLLNRFSYSKITTFFDCSRYWQLYYIEKIRPTTVDPAAQRGIDLHKLYEQLMKANGDEEVCKQIRKAFIQEFPTEFLKFKKWLKDEASLPDGPNKTFEIELQTTQPLMDTSIPVWLYGLIDYLNTNIHDSSFVVDYKSGKNMADPHYADQAAIYALLVFDNYPQVQTITTTLYNISDMMKQGFVEENSYEFQRERDEENLRLTVSKLIDEIIMSVEAGKFVRTPNIRCRYCPDLECQFNKNIKAQKEAKKD